VRRSENFREPPKLGFAMSHDYKPTLFDRYGPDAGNMLRAAAYGVMGLGLAFPLFCVIATKLRLGMLATFSLVGFGSVAAGLSVGFLGALAGNAAGNTWKRFAVDGTSTPYKEQYSYQQALVMQGRSSDALESFEAVIAEKPAEVDARLRAAELYVREQRNFARAAELFREIQRIPVASAGDEVYATNRLVDLLNGPLQDTGRALVELRRLIERYPRSAAAHHARAALIKLKAERAGVA